MHILSTLSIFGEKYILMHISAVFQILHLFLFLCIFVELDSNCIKGAKIAICVLRAQSDTLSIERFSRNRQCTFALATHTRFFLQSQL
jgi:hypothetical protein